jgi:hypothetical protein
VIGRRNAAGPITLHSEEHLVTSDKGIGMLRRLLRKQIMRVADGAIHWRELRPARPSTKPVPAISSARGACGLMTKLTLAEFLQAIPKVELHCHLPGTYAETFLRMAEARGRRSAAQIE